MEATGLPRRWVGPLRKDAVLLRGKLGTSIEAGKFMGRHNAMLKYHVWHHVITGHAPAARFCWSGWGNKLASDRPSPSSPKCDATRRVAAVSSRSFCCHGAGSGRGFTPATLSFARLPAARDWAARHDGCCLHEPLGDCDQGPASLTPSAVSAVSAGFNGFSSLSPKGLELHGLIRLRAISTI